MPGCIYILLSSEMGRDCGCGIVGSGKLWSYGLFGCRLGTYLPWSCTCGFVTSPSEGLRLCGIMMEGLGSYGEAARSGMEGLVGRSRRCVVIVVTMVSMMVLVQVLCGCLDDVPQGGCAQETWR